ncbi:MAG: hypothetical protein KGR98_14285, partial [Verrucomicrobia bacterium]|nr:hypothetical protein [Verrucomicrobiota bacterium]
MAPVLERLKKYGSHAAGSGIILAAAVFLAGCSAPKPPQTIIEHTGNFGGFSALNWTNPSAAPLPAAPPAQTQPQPPPPSVNWIPLNEWAAGHDLAPPRRKGSQIILESSRGKMRLAIGVIEAAWNGIRVSLGYPPRMVDGRVCLSDPDLDKNLEPLLCAPPLGFGTNRVIVIDPGHGGHNSGTHSVL